MKSSAHALWLLGGAAALVALLGGVAAVAWRRANPAPDGAGANSASLTAPMPSPGAPWFVDAASRAGIGFKHFDPATDQHNILETMGSGLAWIDYDNDGWQDLFCIQDGPLHPSNRSGALTNKLYRNLGDGTFADVTEAVGLARSGFGMGCAVGDYDNDGFDDLVVTYWTGIVLYHNEPAPSPLPSPTGGEGKSVGGGRRFVDVSAKAKLHDPHWATSCGWGDIDGDGYLDLYVCNYAEVDLDKYPPCEYGPKKVPYSCPPWMFASVPHRLYRNNGDGTFTDVTESSGIAAASPAPGLGVIFTDLDGDGRIDIYVANDLRPAYLFHNQGGGRFVEKALFSGCGVGSSGEAIAGMGVEAGDIDGSGWPSLFVTNFHKLPNVLFRNAGKLHFHYWTHRSGLGRPSIDRLGFGTVFCDVDLDGQLDIAVANGHVSRNAREVYDAAFAQEAQLFMGQAGGRFRDASNEAGPYFREKRVGRGLAWADYDNDGRPDLAFSHNGGPIALLHNLTDTANNWLRLELIGDGKKSNRNAVGARVEIETAAGRQVRFLNGGGSYLSASERRMLVGLGTAQKADRVTVRWPSGREQPFPNLDGKKWWRLREGVELPEAGEPKTVTKGP